MSYIDNVLNETGLTYRRLDWWTTKGYVGAYEPHPGQGHQRTWQASEIRVATLMRRLVDDAGFTVPGAHDAARKILAGQSEIASGITVTIGAETVASAA